jgi:hypothetical protein
MLQWWWLFVQSNCCVCATDLMTVQLNCSICATSRDCLLGWTAVSARPAYWLFVIWTSLSAQPAYWLFSWNALSVNRPIWFFSWTSLSAQPAYWLFSWTALSAQPAYLIVQLNFLSAQPAYWLFSWTALSGPAYRLFVSWTALSLLTVCQLNFSVRATGLLNLSSVELLPLRDVSVLWSSVITAESFYSKLLSPSFKHLFFSLDPRQNFPLSTIFFSSVSIYISHKFRCCKHSVYSPAWFLVLLAWTITLSTQEAVRVIKCLHAG